MPQIPSLTVAQQGALGGLLDPILGTRKRAVIRALTLAASVVSVLAASNYAVAVTSLVAGGINLLLSVLTDSPIGNAGLTFVPTNPAQHFAPPAPPAG